jgi:hypothetical protein
MRRFVGLLALALILGSCAKQETHYVEYILSGSVPKCNVIYDDKNETVVRQDTVEVGWLYGFNARQSQFLYFSAENPQSEGVVTVTIRIDGKLYQTNTATGGYTIATASGTIQ